MPAAVVLPVTGKPSRTYSYWRAAKHPKRGFLEQE